MAKQPDSDKEYSTEDLAIERLRVSHERLVAAYRNFDDEDYSTAANRAYYSIYQSLIAIHALDRKQYSRHKDAVAKFNENYVATDRFPKDFGRAIHKAAKLRDTSDYVDFKVPSRESTMESIRFAEEFLYSVRDYCEYRLNKAISLERPNPAVNTNAESKHHNPPTR